MYMDYDLPMPSMEKKTGSLILIVRYDPVFLQIWRLYDSVRMMIEMYK